MSAPQPYQPTREPYQPAPQPYQPAPQQQPYYPPQGYPQQQQQYAPQYPQQPQYQGYAAPKALPFTPGNFFLRFVAWLLDDLFVGMITGVIIGVLWALGLLMGYMAGDGGGVLLAGVALWFATIPIAVFTFFAYHIKFETGPGQATLGKKLVGLKIYDQNGGPISAGQSIGRILSMIFLSSLFLGLGYFLALFTEKKQALHDLVAGTVVIKA
jgi:uncharacterized RDD family membrane protein YckC